jgi:hypothetical protein
VRLARGQWLRRLEPAFYAVLAGVLVLAAARLFYGSLRLQIFYSSLRGDPYLHADDWSAPLDDVFIHFDFARSAARGHPFEWSRGNGYSSGGTSLLYPLVLAPGYRLGFRGGRLMEFAAIVACTSVFAVLLASRRLFRDLPAWTSYAAPPLLLGVGALDWSLFSGMEVAFFLATWALAFVAWDDLVRGHPDGGATPSVAAGAAFLGFASAIVVATRPEAAVVVAVFGVSAAIAVGRRSGARRGALVLAFAGVPAALVLVAEAVANRIFTGDFSAAGALVKLEMNDPRLSAREVWDAWVFHVRYQIGRVTGYHIGDGLLRGSWFWVLAALPLAFRRTRHVAIVLWAQAVLWVLVVALNGQVRWQNERYTMPALAWMLLSAALGIGVVLSETWEGRTRARLLRVGSTGATLALTLFLATGQVPRFRDQVWFFGRASRNIRDQHVKVARKIRREIPGARRVLVGDAGAIPYESDLPALDIIGLGGYPGLPFARASRWGVAAALELIERIPPADRPDVMAIYPGWWGDFPLWFGRPLDGVSVRGNVICGGLTKMIYEARFRPLDHSGAPVTPARDDEEAIDEIDFADLLSEDAHDFRVRGAVGHVAMKLLPHPRLRFEELWDAGRVVPPSASVDFVLRGFRSGAPGRLVLRTAPPQPVLLHVRVDGAEVAVVPLSASDGWQEASIDVPGGKLGTSTAVTLSVEHNELVVYHLWGYEKQ